MEKTLVITITSTDKDFTDEKVCETIFQQVQSAVFDYTKDKALSFFKDASYIAEDKEMTVQFILSDDWQKKKGQRKNPLPFLF